MLIVLGLLGCALGNAGARWMRPIGHSQSHSADESIRFADPGRAGYPVVQPRSGVLRVQAQGETSIEEVFRAIPTEYLGVD